MSDNMAHLEAMAVFAAVVEEGSFTKAAQRLGCSKAHVSQLVSRLEQRFSTQFLFRTTRRLDTTEAGKAFFEYCRDITQTALKAEKALEALKGDVSGKLRLSAPISFGEVFLGDITFGFMADFPAVRFELDLDNRIRDLQAEKIDVALRATTQLDDDLVAIRLGEWRDYVCAAPEYLAGKKAIEQPTDLAFHSCLVNARNLDTALWRFWKEESSHVIPIEGKMSVHHFPMLKSAVLKGAGVAKLPSYLARDEIEKGRLVRLLPDYELEAFPIFIVYPYQKDLPLKLRKFVDYVKRWFADNPHFQ
ncbi:LysR family transcriptional regulator [Kiloniella laminariae]|uniref:LysR family transcriptional regulator n=1 Tax=Kiloniella laminariae TaxID=454162 RepID=UPI00035D4B18|nr:LysR family transcriptional regulator [Kiloniella laminariae]